MFVEDRALAVSEMARVTSPGGRVAVATWAAIEESPGYAAMVGLLDEVLGHWAAEALRAPFCIGTTDGLKDLLLIDSFFARGVGVGVRHRSAAAGVQVTTNASYTAPTATVIPI